MMLYMIILLRACARVGVDDAFSLKFTFDQGSKVVGDISSLQQCVL